MSNPNQKPGQDQRDVHREPGQDEEEIEREQDVREELENLDDNGRRRDNIQIPPNPD